MKKTFRAITVIIAAVAGLYACTIENPDKGVNGVSEKGLFVVATTDCGTKAKLSGTDEKGYDVVWQAEDKITIGGKTFELSSGEGTTKGVFKLVSDTAPGEGTFDAYYPAAYNGKNWVNEQTYINGNITGLPLRAKAVIDKDDIKDLLFYNAGGIFRVNVTSSSSIKVKTVTVTAKELSAPITLTCKDPVALDSKGVVFHIAIPENVKGYSDFRVTFRDENGNLLDAKTAKEKLTIKRNNITRASFEITDGAYLKVATYNVDGLPVKIQMGWLVGGIVKKLGIEDARVDDNYNLYINDDGPGSEGSKIISAKIAEKGWDVVGLNEDFNYHKEITSCLGGYEFGKHQGSFPTGDLDYWGLYWKYDAKEPLFEIDGLGIATKTDYCSWSNEVAKPWNDNATYGYLDHSSDRLTKKGFRYYTVNVDKSGVKASIDFIVLHADAGGGAEDIAARENAYAQLISYIQTVKTGNPMILMGDFNTKYARDKFKTLFIDKLNAISGVKASDAWVEFNNGGVYPTSEQSGLPQATEKLDKIVFLNRDSAPIELKLKYEGNLLDFVYPSGEDLSDHIPVEATFRIVERKK